MPSPTGASTCWSSGNGERRSVNVVIDPVMGSRCGRACYAGNPPVRGGGGPMQVGHIAVCPGQVYHPAAWQEPEWSRQILLGGGNGAAG